MHYWNMKISGFPKTLVRNNVMASRRRKGLLRCKGSSLFSRVCSLQEKRNSLRLHERLKNEEGRRFLFLAGRCKFLCAGEFSSRCFLFCLKPYKKEGRIIAGKTTYVFCSNKKTKGEISCLIRIRLLKRKIQ